jgi:hypothetical protein
VWSGDFKEVIQRDPGKTDTGMTGWKTFMVRQVIGASGQNGKVRLFTTKKL